MLEHGSAAALELEVIVVDDGSTDGTRERVRSWERDHPVRLLPREGQRGLASAVLAGAAVATGAVVVVMDSDLSHPPQRISDLARPVLADDSDLAIGSRYVRGGATPGWPVSRRVISRTAAAAARVFTSVRDPLSGFFAVRRDRLLELGARSIGFKIGLEVLVRGGETLRVIEVPIVFRDRAHGSSKLGAGVAAAYLRQLVALAGGAVSGGSAVRFALVGLCGLVVDLLVFHAFSAAGASLGSAHIASFLVATAVNYVLDSRWAFAKHSRGGGGLTWHGYLSFAAVALMAVFLRGGVLALFVKRLGWDVSAAMLPAIVAAALVNYLGCAFYVFAPSANRPEPSMRWSIAGAGVVVYVLVLRLLYLGQVDLIPEEAYYWNYSEHPDFSYLDHPPMVAWLIWLGVRLFGDTELAVRSGSVACWLLAVVFAGLLTRNLVGKSAAFRSMLLLGILPFFFGVGFLMTPDSPLVACWAGALYFLERALLGERRPAWLGVGACLGLGLLSKYTIALLVPAAVTFMLLDARSRRWLLRPDPYCALLAALLLFSPVLLWNAENGWASFAFQGPERWRHVGFSLPQLVASILILITPIGLLGFTLGSARARAARRPIQVRSCRLSDRGSNFVRALTLVPLAVFIVASLHSETKLNWTGPVWLAALPAMAVSMLAHDALPGRWMAHVWKPTVLLLTLGYGAAFHIPVLGLPGLTLRPSYYTMDWQELGRQVEALECEVIDKTGKEPVIVGMDKYHLSSELAFYDPNLDGAHETAGLHLFGEKSLMYEYWFPAKRLEGKSLVLVGTDPTMLACERVLEHVEELEPIRELQVERQGALVGRYYARVAHGYHSVAAAAATPPPDRHR